MLKKKGELKAALCRTQRRAKQPTNETTRLEKDAYSRIPGVVVAEGKGEVGVDVDE